MVEEPKDENRRKNDEWNLKNFSRRKKEKNIKNGKKTKDNKKFIMRRVSKNRGQTEEMNSLKTWTDNITWEELEEYQSWKREF